MKLLHSFFQKFQKNTLLFGTIIFLFLGICTRFSFLENPKEVVFDEFHFFHFVSEYEEGKYFFDIHPPLGKLILWANAQMYGLPEFIEESNENIKKKEKLELEQKKLKNKILTLKKNSKSEIELKTKLTKKYKQNKEKIKDLNEHASGLSSIAIGKEYSDTLNIYGIRSLPAFFGAALVALMFYFAYFLTSSYAISTLIGFITLFSPAFLVESQYVLMDSMLMFFVILGGLFSLKYYKNTTWTNWIMIMLTSAIVISIKWTGASIVGFAGLIWIIVIFQNKISFKKWISQFLAFWIFVPVFYMGTFSIHFALLPNSGEGDAFHTPEFRANLENTSENINNKIIPKTFFLNTKKNTNNTNEKLTTFLQFKKNPFYKKNKTDEYILDWENWLFYGKFIELNKQMGERSAAIRDNHPFASRPSDWIHGKKSIYLWNKEGEYIKLNEEGERVNENYREPKNFIPKLWNKYIGENFTKPENFQNRYVQQLHLFTNSILWSILPYSTAFLLLIIFIFQILSHLNYLNNNKNYFIFSFFIIFITLINIIPFVLIERPQFLYHAFEGVLFAILGLALSLKTIYFIPNDIISENLKNNILWGFTAFITILLFIFFIIELPLIYGFPFHDSMAHSMFQLF